MFNNKYPVKYVNIRIFVLLEYHTWNQAMHIYQTFLITNVDLNTIYMYTNSSIYADILNMSVCSR